MAKQSSTYNDDNVKDATLEEQDVAALSEPEPEPEKRDYTDVRFGDENASAVKDVQRALGVEETGVYDAELMHTVQRWQNENGFVGGTGVWLNSVQLERLLK